jgi:hypothetical protein
MDHDGSIGLCVSWGASRWLDWIGLDWIGLDWIGLDWIGLDWIGLDWIGRSGWAVGCLTYSSGYLGDTVGDIGGSRQPVAHTRDHSSRGSDWSKRLDGCDLMGAT